MILLRVILKMDGADLSTNQQHIGIRISFADGVGKFYSIKGGIATHKVYCSALHGGWQFKSLNQFNIQAGSVHAGSAHRDEVSDLRKRNRDGLCQAIANSLF